jgi:hypothetical protein
VEEFSVGRALARTVRIYAKNLASFLAVSALMWLPYGAYLFLAADPQVLFVRSLPHQTITFLAGSVLPELSAAVIIYATIMELKGEHIGIGKCLIAGLRRARPVLLIAVVVGLLTSLPQLPAYL